MQVFRMKSKGGIKINCQCKELIDKGVCDEGFISNRNKKQMKINSALHCVIFNNLYNQHWNGIGTYFVYFIIGT